MAKSTKTRLEQLEQSAKAGAMSWDARVMLVTILGRRDGLFEPARTWGQWRSPREQKQLAYLNGETGIPARASGKAQWRDAQGTREELVSAGYCVAIKSGGETTGLILTQTGEAFARAMVGGVFTLNSVETRNLWKRMVDLVPLSPPFLDTHYGPARWLSESQLAGRWLYGDPSQWREVTEAMLPLLVSGFVHANADAHGRLYYSMRFDNDYKHATELPTQPKLNADIIDGMQDLYVSESDSAYIASQLDTSNDLVVPIPVSCWYSRDCMERLMDASIPRWREQFSEVAA